VGQLRMENCELKTTQMLPVLLIAINLASAGVYLADGDWRKVVYWVSAACLTFVVTF